MASPSVEFQHWVHLQKCLKYERVRLNHDEQDKRKLLDQLTTLHIDYYRYQLKIRELLGKSSKRKVLVSNLREFLGDHYVYVEHFVKHLRNSDEVFNLVVSLCPPNMSHLELVAESFAYSFFEDLMNPENSELELLKVIKSVMKLEFRNYSSISDIFNENVSTVLGKILTIYTKRRTQRKYLRLLFKKTMIKIVHSEERDLRLDPRGIYKRLQAKMRVSQIETIPEEAPKKKSFFANIFGGRSKDKSKTMMIASQVFTRDFEEFDNTYYLEDRDVKARISLQSEVIINYSKQLLKPIYDNVKTMPHGIKWLCRCISELSSQTREISVLERNTMLGTFLFTKWWLPSLSSADSNGLIQDCIIPTVVRSNLGLISNVLKHLFREQLFEEPQYEIINNFIKKEIPNMRRYFDQILEGDLTPNLKTRHSSILEQSPGITYTEKGDTMTYFYTRTVNRPENKKLIMESSHLPDAFKDFKLQGIALSVPELRELVGVVLRNEDKFREAGHTSVFNSAKRIKRAMEEDNFLRDVDSADSLDVHYMLFIEQTLPDSMDSSSRKRNTLPVDEDAKMALIMKKVKEAIKDLLFAMDSFSMFFDQDNQSSLLDIVEFVLKFSYLFDSKKSSANDRVPINLLAQYLKSNLIRLPQRFQDNNFAQLYKSLIYDYETLFSQKRKLASKNRQKLLVAINSLEKHIYDIKQEEKVQTSLQRTRDFISFISEAVIPVCVCPQTAKQGGEIIITKQRECFHTRLDYVNVLVPVAKRRPSTKSIPTMKSPSMRSVKSSSRLSHQGSVQAGHVNTIDEFSEEFVKLEPVQKCAESDTDTAKVGEAFFDYINILHEEVMNHPLYKGRPEEEIEGIVEEIEKYITRKMHKDIFPIWATEDDTRLYNKTLSLSWLRPEHLDISPEMRHEEMWTFAIRALKDLDEYMSTVEKLSCLVDFVTTIVNILHLCSSTDAVGADDSMPIIIYLVKTQPERMYSNLNFITKFRHQKKMLADFGFCYSQIVAAIQFIENLDESCLTIEAETYLSNVAQAKVKYNLS